MKYQKRMVLYYTSVALILSLLFGIMLYRIGYSHEKDVQTEQLHASADMIGAQVQNKLEAMDAIIYYMLSDASVLESITMLSSAAEKELNPILFFNAQRSISEGINTVYIYNHSYRTVFFNENGFLESSFTGDPKNQTVSSFILNEIDYLEPVIVAGGKSILVPGHPDNWSRNDKTEVFSLMKAIQGQGMGYIEVENLISELADLTPSDSLTDYIVYTKEACLYCSANVETAWEAVSEFSQDQVVERKGLYLYSKEIPEYSLYVAAFIPKDYLIGQQMSIAVTSFLASIATLLSSILLVIIWSYVLTRPMKRMQAVMEKTDIFNLHIQEEDLISAKETDEMQQLARTYVSMMNRLDTALKNEDRVHALQVQSQFDALQAQVNPHFLYNVLNTISSRGVEDDDELICDMCAALAEMLRYSTSNKERDAFVERELEYLNHYFFLQRSRYAGRIQFHCDVPKSLYKKKLPKLTLQQFAENSYVHGFRDRMGIMEIWVNGHEDEDAWWITIRDNGCGIEAEKLEQLKEKMCRVCDRLENKKEILELEIGGMGLVNVYARCHLMYGDKLIFDVHNVEHGLEVIVGARK